MKRYHTKQPDAAEDDRADRPTFTSEQDAEGHEPAPPQDPADIGFTAVKGTSFGVKRGEVFSLLGVNGAGKSSTFDCLVGFQRVSGGQVLIDGTNVSEFVARPEKLHGIIGYCPQSNNFNGNLTVRQSITMMARLNGIRERLPSYVSSIILQFGLSMFTDT